jgi:hypothetical protein
MLAIVEKQQELAVFQVFDQGIDRGPAAVFGHAKRGGHRLGY